ncbi:DUF433 domain-containing protein [Prosthecomicrobium hirschii]|uniref:DUF433 domain-containing protein n=1 Tax=Prosthecodimorpha hirschii TaxID=665126 RepID=UPI00221E795E|nr:DUF433 domain-containing protein [Prosthecomicrobium hirschii]MCW1840998.1 DUF433 domain-containing protein [Prosthecomicrobium hirschii]
MATASGERAAVHSGVVERDDILGGMPCVSGTRVPAMTIVAELRSGASVAEILDGYPSLPADAVDAVSRWAQARGIPLGPSAP